MLLNLEDSNFKSRTSNAASPAFTGFVRCTMATELCRESGRHCLRLGKAPPVPFLQRPGFGLGLVEP